VCLLSARKATDEPILRGRVDRVRAAQRCDPAARRRARASGAVAIGSVASSRQPWWFVFAAALLALLLAGGLLAAGLEGGVH
jgi:hypothetical protein